MTENKLSDLKKRLSERKTVIDSEKNEDEIIRLAKVVEKIQLSPDINRNDLYNEKFKNLLESPHPHKEYEKIEPPSNCVKKTPAEFFKEFNIHDVDYLPLKMIQFGGSVEISITNQVWVDYNIETLVVTPAIAYMISYNEIPYVGTYSFLMKFYILNMHPSGRTQKNSCTNTAREWFQKTMLEVSNNRAFFEKERSTFFRDKLIKEKFDYFKKCVDMTDLGRKYLSEFFDKLRSTKNLKFRNEHIKDIADEIRYFSYNDILGLTSIDFFPKRSFEFLYERTLKRIHVINDDIYKLCVDFDQGKIQSIEFWEKLKSYMYSKLFQLEMFYVCVFNEIHNAEKLNYVGDIYFKNPKYIDTLMRKEFPSEVPHHICESLSSLRYGQTFLRTNRKTEFSRLEVEGIGDDGGECPKIDTIKNFVAWVISTKSDDCDFSSEHIKLVAINLLNYKKLLCRKSDQEDMDISPP